MKNIDEKTLQKRRYLGYQNTPFLWSNKLFGLSMFEIEVGNNNDFRSIQNPNIRLGKLTEEFVLSDLRENCKILASNLQIFREKVTIGELDALIELHKLKIHLEIVFKFYLYDPSIQEKYERWIGPNKKDSLMQKVSKLQNKQLPLLYEKESTKLLQELDLDIEEFQQKVHFKAQLFIPINTTNFDTASLNKECIKGFYLKRNELNEFKNYSFYIPTKLDWLIEPHEDVRWLLFSEFKENISPMLENKISPLCWFKSPELSIAKIFVVWW